MRLGVVGAGLVAWVGAVLSSLCCLAPLAVILLGLGSGAFMALTMPYRWLLIPAGVGGVLGGLALYARERRRCRTVACRMGGRRATLAALMLAALVVTTAIVLDEFPGASSDVLAWLTESSARGGPGPDLNRAVGEGRR